MTTRIFNVKEAAEFLRVSARTVERAMKSGELESTRIGDRRLITDQQLEKFLQANKVTQ